MRKAEGVGNNDCPVKIKLVAAPLYVMTAETLDKDQGISVLNEAIVACTQAIEQHKGNLVVKEAPRAVSEQDAKLLAEHMGRLWHANEDVSGDEDSEVEEEEEEEDTGMGEVDVENTGCVGSAAAYTNEVEEEEDKGMGEVDVENTGCVRSAAAYTIFIFNLTRIISIFMLLVI
nr:eukaryotic translation initiation factor 2 subunit alpha homolog [Ziziphus jujuba var. spinosa]